MPQEYLWCKERFVVKKFRKGNLVPSQVNFREQQTEIGMVIFIFSKLHMSIVSLGPRNVQTPV